MKITQKRTDLFLRFYERLLEYAEEYCKTFPGRHGSVRITTYGTIEEKINTSCHCHPTYEYVERGNVQELVEWINNKQK